MHDRLPVAGRNWRRLRRLQRREAAGAAAVCLQFGPSVGWAPRAESSMRQDCGSRILDFGSMDDDHP